jgi:hypothetical protein
MADERQAYGQELETGHRGEDDAAKGETVQSGAT